MVDYMGVELPTTTYKAAKPGKNVIVMAGVHGIELHAIRLLHTYIQAFSPLRVVAGSVTFAPLVNASAFANATREAEDGKDLNRTYPGNAGGTASEVLSHTIMTKLVATSDLVLDIHSGTENLYLTPHVRVNRKYLELGKIFGTGIVYLRRATEGMLAWAADEYYSVPAITIEVGGGPSGLPQFEHDVFRGLDNMLIDAGVLSGQISVPSRQYVIGKKYRTHFTSPHCGIIKVLYNPGDHVHAGDIIATVYNPLTFSESTVVSATCGVVFSLTVSDRVTAGDRVLSLLTLRSCTQCQSEVLLQGNNL